MKIGSYINICIKLHHHISVFILDGKYIKSKKITKIAILIKIFIRNFFVWG